MKEILEFNNIISVVIAYLIGSVPSAIWVSKWFFGIDVRDYGSKNAGATNTFRVIGKKAGFPVLFFDILKGWGAVKGLCLIFSSYTICSDQFVNLELAIGVAAVFGHVFPVYEGFKGGKGVASYFGGSLFLLPIPTILAMIIWFFTVKLSKHSSLGALLSIFLLTIYQLVFIYGNLEKGLVFVIFLLIFFKHNSNIKRLIKGEENKINL